MSEPNGPSVYVPPDLLDGRDVSGLRRFAPASTPAVLSADEADFAGPLDPEQYRRGHLDGRALVTGLLPDVARYALDVETRRRDAARRELAYLDGRVAGCRVGLAAQCTPTTGDTETTA